jgi:enamine deaminase RidA (YjgF/YER057c/UK114 family)
MPLPGAGPEATRRGDLLFIPVQTGLLPELGRVPRGPEDLPAEARQRLEARAEVHPLEWSVAAQTWAIYHKLERILARHGAGLDSLVRTNTYFRDQRDFPPMERARAALLQGIPPASSVVQAGDRGLDPELRLLVEAVAALPPGRKEPLGGRMQAPAHFSVGLRAGGLVWTAGQTGYDPATGAHLRGIADLPEDQRWMASTSLHLNVREGPMLAQAWQAYRNLAAILEDGGSGLDRLVREVVYLREPRLLPLLDRVRRRVFGPEAALMPTTVVSVAEVSRESAALLEIDMVAAPQPPRRAPEPALGHARTARAGAWLFLSDARGLTPAGQPVAALADLDPEGRALLSSLPAPMPPAALQAWPILRELPRLLERHGLAPQGLAKLTCYVDDFTAAGDIQRLAAVALGEAIPAMTILAVPSVDPDPRVRLKLDAIVHGG